VAVPVGRLPIEVRGRNELLSSLAGRTGLVVLTGMGGVGKSTVAAGLARIVHRTGRTVWWVSAADQSTFAAGIVTVARDTAWPDHDLFVLLSAAAFQAQGK
jgi:thymidylate kinase